MASITIRNLDDDLKRRRRVRAAENGRSMEAEMREILRHAVSPPSAPQNLGQFIHERLLLLAASNYLQFSENQAGQCANLSNPLPFCNLFASEAKGAMLLLAADVAKFGQNGQNGSRQAAGSHMQTLSAKDAKYSFGRLIDLARAGPLAVAKHGRPVVVVMAIEEYDRLKGIEAGRQNGPDSTDGADE